MTQPQITVGILSGKEIEFSFPVKFSSSVGTEISGTQKVIYQDGKIHWQGKEYDELSFIPPQNAHAFFELKDVTIGINFHWERKEVQKFKGELKIIIEGEQLTAINVISIEEYLTSVISSEMSATASLELLKAHAVISRSWLLEKNKELRMKNEEFPSYSDINYVDQVSCKEIIHYFPSGTSSHSAANSSFFIPHSSLKKVVLVDCGVKTNIIRCLLKRNVEVIRVPWDYDYNGFEFDGLFISNGPGDPDTCDAAVQNIRKAMSNEKLPIFGICMGNQLLSKAGGAKIYKLKYGHRSHNQPVRMVGTERCFITSQNHGYAVDNNTLSADWEPLFINMNDGSNEGIKHKRNPWFSAQFHPEAASGPTDTEFLFDEFVKLL